MNDNKTVLTADQITELCCDFGMTKWQVKAVIDKLSVQPAASEAGAVPVDATDEMIDAACGAVPDLFRVDAMKALEAALRVAGQGPDSKMRQALSLARDGYASMRATGQPCHREFTDKALDLIDAALGAPPPAPAAEPTDEAIDALLDEPANVAYAVSDKRGQLRLLIHAALRRFAAPAAEPVQNAAVAAIQFALEADGGLDWLSYWNEGEFDICRKEWPETPEECFIGADPLNPLTIAAAESAEPGLVRDWNSYMDERARSSKPATAATADAQDDETCEYCGRRGGDVCDTPPVDVCERADDAGAQLCEDEGCPHHGEPHVCTSTGAVAPAAANPTSQWLRAEKLANVPAVYEALQVFCEDLTGDNGTGVIAAVLEALAAESAEPGPYFHMYADLCDKMGYDSGKDSLEWTPEEWAAELLRVYRAQPTAATADAQDDERADLRQLLRDARHRIANLSRAAVPFDDPLDGPVLRRLDAALSRQPSAAASAQGDERAKCLEFVKSVVQRFDNLCWYNDAVAVRARELVSDLSRQPSAAASAPEAPHPDSGHHERYIAGWNACRAALAAAKPERKQP